MTYVPSAWPADESCSLLLRRAVDADRAADPADASRLRWELADPWAAPDRPPAAEATTYATDHVVQLTDFALAPDAPDGATRCLVQQLVATLRRTDAELVSCALENRSLREELLAAGFVAFPEEGRARSEPTRLILQL